MSLCLTLHSLSRLPVNTAIDCSTICHTCTVANWTIWDNRSRRQHDTQKTFWPPWLCQHSQWTCPRSPPSHPSHRPSYSLSQSLSPSSQPTGLSRRISRIPAVERTSSLRSPHSPAVSRQCRSCMRTALEVWTSCGRPGRVDGRLTSRIL